MEKSLIFLFFLILSYANEIYLDSSYSGSISDGTNDKPLNNLENIQKSLINGDSSIFIIQNFLYIDKPIIIQNGVFNFR